MKKGQVCKPIFQTLHFESLNLTSTTAELMHKAEKQDPTCSLCEVSSVSTYIS